MQNKPTRSYLKREFFAGRINAEEFNNLLKTILQYRGFYIIPRKKPRWSGPWRDTEIEANRDNEPFFNQGYQVDVYIEQK